MGYELGSHGWICSFVGKQKWPFSKQLERALSYLYAGRKTGIVFDSRCVGTKVK